MMGKESNRKNKMVLRIAAVLFWLIVWHVVSVFIGEKLLLVSPVLVAQRLFELIFTLSFWQTVWFSVARIITGFLAAIVMGVVLAGFAAAFSWVKILLYPIMTVIKTTPVVSFIILALVWISSKNLSVFISFLMVLPVVYTNTLTGIVNTDVKLIEMARVFRISMMKKFIYIYLPHVTPYFVSACSLSLGLCWKSGVAAEVIGLPDGSIGEKLYMAKLYFGTADIFAWTIVVILLSMIFEKIVLWLMSRMQNKLWGEVS